MATNTGPSGVLWRVRAGLALAAAGALLAACGSSSKGGSTGTSVAASTTPSTASSSSSGSTAETGSTPNLGGGSFCDKIRSAIADETKSASSITTGTPDQLKELWQRASAELSQLESSAPSDIKDSVTTIGNATTALFKDLQDSNFDVTKAGPQLESHFTSPQFAQAVRQVNSYLATKCGINPTDLPSA